MKETTRAHVVIPKELLAAVDEIVGNRRRSEFIAQALQEKLARERRTRALAETAGILDPVQYPEWETPEQVSAWVRESRAADEAHTRRKLRR